MDYEIFIPIVAIVVTFSFPVALVFVSKWFKLRERELQMEAESRRWNEEHAKALESRVQRLESIVLSLDKDVRATLMEAPPTPASGEPGPLLKAPLKVR